MRTETGTLTSLFFIDDDLEDLQIFRQIVNSLGRSVEVFRLPDDMLHAMDNPPPAPSIIFLDLNMPGKSGYVLLEELRKSPAFENLPIVIYSTADNAVVAEKCRTLGASLYVSKPTSVKETVKALEYVLSIDWDNFVTNEHNFRYKG